MVEHAVVAGGLSSSSIGKLDPNSSAENGLPRTIEPIKTKPLQSYLDQEFIERLGFEKHVFESGSFTFFNVEDGEETKQNDDKLMTMAQKREAILTATGRNVKPREGIALNHDSDHESDEDINTAHEHHNVSQKSQNGKF